MEARREAALPSGGAGALLEASGRVSLYLRTSMVAVISTGWSAQKSW